MEGYALFGLACPKWAPVACACACGRVCVGRKPSRSQDMERVEDVGHTAKLGRERKRIGYLCQEGALSAAVEWKLA